MTDTAPVSDSPEPAAEPVVPAAPEPEPPSDAPEEEGVAAPLQEEPAAGSGGAPAAAPDDVPSPTGGASGTNFGQPMGEPTVHTGDDDDPDREGRKLA